jgi:hypothetical protein
MLGGAAALAGGVGGVGALAGCAKKPTRELEPHPDVAVLLGAIATEEHLITLYESTRKSHPELSRRIDPLLAHHRDHLTVLRRHYRPGTDPDSTSVSRVGATGPAAAAAGDVPRSRRQAVAALRTAERRAATARTADVARVAPGLAQLLASIAACEAGHMAWLTRVS